MTTTRAARLHPDDRAAIVAEVVDALRTQGVTADMPPELTIAQVMLVANRRSLSATYRWLKEKRIRPIGKGRYSLRRVQSALAA